MRCTNCGCENEEGKFCAYCGNVLYDVAHCVRCGREIPIGHELCVNCLSRPVKKKKSSKGLVAAVVVMILVIIAIGGLLLWYFSDGSWNTQKHQPVNIEETKTEQNSENNKKETKSEPKKLQLVGLEASSEYEIVTEKKGIKNGYYVKYLNDNNHKTAWSPERDDENPWVEFTFDKKRTVSKIVVENGYSKSEDLYYQNARAEKILVECDGFSEEYILEDLGCEATQTIELKENVETKSAKITVLSVYKGEERNGVIYDDLCITEINILGF